MFQINSMLLCKMGWLSAPPRGRGLKLPQFYFKNKDKIFYIKQLSENSYNFEVGEEEIVKLFEFNSNMELLKLIIKFEACNEDYIRHFKLNKILLK